MTVLDAIIAGVREDLDARRTDRPLARVREDALAAAPVRPFPPAGGFGLICEVKRSSPSKGALAGIPDPAALAARQEEHVAALQATMEGQDRFIGSFTHRLCHHDHRGHHDHPCRRFFHHRGSSRRHHGLYRR